MKNLPLVVLIIIVFVFECYSQWVQQQSNTSYHLHSIYMFDANKGFVAGEYQTIRKTTNGGLNWLTVMPIPNLDYLNISFLNTNTGVISGWTSFIQTYNGGSTWIQRNTNLDYVAKMQYIDSMIIYAQGGYGVMKSTNGGINWFYIDTSNYYLNFRSLFFINKDTGTVVGQHALIKTTINGGTTWTTRILGLPIPFGDSTLTDVQYVNALTGYACGNNGIVIKTTNGGINWSYKPTPAPYLLPAMYFTDTNTGTVVGYPIIYRTTNSGDNWISQPYPTNDPLGDVYFVSKDTGWIVGFNGTILYTSDGGVEWIKPISNDVPSEFKLVQNYPNPFNPTTKIKFEIPGPFPPFTGYPLGQGGQGGLTTLKIYDILGREIATLINERLQPGTYEVDWDSGNYPSGVYLYRLISGDYSETKKMVLLK